MEVRKALRAMRGDVVPGIDEILTRVTIRTLAGSHRDAQPLLVLRW